MAHWAIEVSDKTDHNVRDYLARTGERDLSSFVERVVRQHIFWETTRRIKERTKNLPPETTQTLLENAVAWARKQQD